MTLIDAWKRTYMICAWNRTNFGIKTIEPRSEILITTTTAVLKCPLSMHKQLLKISVFFHFHHSRTNRLCWYVGRAHQHCPPHNGESHKNHDAWKKERILSLAGGRTRSTGRYPERERTFSQKHSVKEQIKQWYVWLISGQQLLLFYSITKLLTQLKLSFVFTTKFPGISVYFMYNLTSDS